MPRLGPPLLLACLFGCATAAPPPAPATIPTAPAAAPLLPAPPRDARGDRAARLAAALEADIVSDMAAFEIPGLSIAVVDGGEVALLAGHGVRKAGAPDPVDADTIFALGSCTKAFTATLAAMAVSDKKIGWDDPARRVYPDLVLPGPGATDVASLRDLLNHRSGIGASGDAGHLWYASGRAREDVIHRLRFEKPESGFREKFAYSNLAYLVAGEVTAKALGTPWDDAIAARIFGPLGMRRSSTTIRGLEADANVATPHEWIDRTLTAVPHRSVDNLAPGGGVNSTARDMAAWMRFQLDEGVVAGAALVDPKALRETHTPQTMIRISDKERQLHPETHFWAYEMGWYTLDYAGRKIDYHYGSIDGMAALVVLVPEERLGMTVLVNRGDADLSRALFYRFLDAAFGLPDRPWARTYLALARKDLEEVDEERRKEAAAVEQDAAPTASRAGVFSDAMYGDVQVSEDAEKRVLHFGAGWVGDLEHLHGETFRVRWRDRLLGSDRVTFLADEGGRLNGLRIDFAPWSGDGPLSFHRATAVTPRGKPAAK